jgi:hypothetical protein
MIGFSRVTGFEIPIDEALHPPEPTEGATGDMHETNKAEVLARLGSWGKAARHFVAGMLLGLAPLSGFSQIALNHVLQE